MHRVTVTPLPATPQDEPIEVGSYWKMNKGGGIYVVTAYIKLKNEIHLFDVVLNEPLLWGELAVRANMTRLRNVRIEIEVQ